MTRVGLSAWIRRGHQVEGAQTKYLGTFNQLSDLSHGAHTQLMLPLCLSW